MNRNIKNSGIKWISDVPQNWKITKLGNIANLYIGNSIKDSDKDNYNNLENTIPYIATKDVKNDNTINYENGMYTKESDKKFKVATKNTTLICIEGGSAGVKIAYLNKNVTFGNKLCALESKNINSKYLYYYTLSPGFSESFNSRITGLIPGVTLTELSKIEVPIPFIDDQKQIAKLLDKKTHKIRKLIKETQESIIQLKSYKQSIITEAVTKGLNPSSEMKKSDIKWAEKIPTTWSSGKFKLALTRKKKIIEKYIDEPVLSLTLNGVIERDLKNTKGKMPSTFDGYQKIDSGNLITCLFDIDVTPRCVGVSHVEGITSPAYTQFEIKKEFDTMYMYYYLLMMDFHKLLIPFTKSLRNTITSSDFLNINFAFPTFKEQQEIVEYLDEKTSLIDKLIEDKTKLIDELENYKKSVIYEYVTGKKEA